MSPHGRGRARSRAARTRRGREASLQDLRLARRQTPRRLPPGTGFVSCSSYRKSNKPQPMCIDEATSLTTFCLGTALNSLFFAAIARDTRPKNSATRDAALAALLFWQYALLMQVPDYFAWRNLRLQLDTHTSARFAWALNVSQPFVLCGFACLLLGDRAAEKQLSLLPLAILYVYSLATSFPQAWSLSPVPPCPTLEYGWWWGSSGSAILYVAWIAGTCAVLIAERVPLSGLNLAIFVISLLATKLLLSPCNPASLWCWSVALAGPLVFLAYRANQSSAPKPAREQSSRDRNQRVR